MREEVDQEMRAKIAILSLKNLLLGSDILEEARGVESKLSCQRDIPMCD